MMISLDLMKLSEVRIVGDRSKYERQGGVIISWKKN